MKKCLVCNGEFDDTDTGFNLRNGFVCLGCEHETMTVYKITEAKPGNALYLSSLEETMEEIEAGLIWEEGSGDGYTVTSHKVKALWYYDLPEFGGF